MGFLIVLCCGLPLISEEIEFYDKVTPSVEIVFPGVVSASILDSSTEIIKQDIVPSWAITMLDELNDPGPEILIDLPENDFQTSSEKLAIRGQVINTKTLYINDEKKSFNHGGWFYLKIPLQEGMNEITLKAFSKHKHMTKVVKKVRRI